MQVQRPILRYKKDFRTDPPTESTIIHFAGSEIEDPPPELCVEVKNLQEGQRLLFLMTQREIDIGHQARIEEHAKLQAAKHE